MSNQIIGRSKEIERLRRIVESDRAELVAVYGRRRIGKTFLVKEFFNGIAFAHTGGFFNAALDIIGRHIGCLSLLNA